MARPAKIVRAARLIVAKYGRAGPTIARRRARQASARRDDAAASAWMAIARAANAVLSPSKDEARASLSEVLDGGVTRQVMTADGVKREEVEHLMEQTKDRRDNE
jgi:hypothetical protein